MSKIRVLLPETFVDIYSLSQEEREIVLEGLYKDLQETSRSKKSQSVPKNVFDRFIECFNEEIRLSNALTIPNVRELALVKKILLSATPIAGFYINRPNTLAPVHLPGQDLVLRFDRSIIAMSGSHERVFAPGDNIPTTAAIVPIHEHKFPRDPNYKRARDLISIGLYTAATVYDSNDTPFSGGRYQNPNLLDYHTRGYYAQFVNAMIRLSQPVPPAYSISIPAVPDSEDPVIRLLNELSAGKFIAGPSAVADAYSRGLDKVYNNAAVYGIDHSSVQNTLEQYRAAVSRRQFAIAASAAAAAADQREAILIGIIKKKFGTKRYLSAVAAKSPTQSIINVLTKTERGAVETEYAKAEEYAAGVVGNKCPHVNVARRLRTTTDERSLKSLLTELTTYYAKIIPGAQIKCKLCNYNIICPHVNDYFAILTHAEGIDTKNTSALLRAKMAKYAEGNARSSSFCKICGETLSDKIEGIEDSPGMMMDEELKNFIWNEASISFKYYKFGPTIDVPRLISRVRDAIYTHVFDAEKQILKAKTTTAEDIKARKRLSVSIWTTAQMIHLVAANAGPNPQISMRGVTNGKLLPELIKRGIENIALSRVTIIRSIPGMTVDVIKTNLINA